MSARDRLMMEQTARSLRVQADELMRFSPLQALRLMNVAQDLELRLTKLAHSAVFTVRA